MKIAFALATLTTGATFVLILAGGLVTNTGSALAVPDWPTTFGHNMFLFPWSGMVGGILYEHSHRLLGAVVGLLTCGLATALWRAGGSLRGLGLLAVAAVVVQGGIGGLRVVLLQDTLAIVHGSLAQAFFALLAVIAFLTSRYTKVPASGPREGGMRTWTVLATALVYMQIVLGALLTHAGFLALHLTGAALVSVFVPIVTGRLRRAGDPVAGALARTLLALLAIQLLLGAGAFVARFTSLALPGEQTMTLALPVAHRLAASLLLAIATILSVRIVAGRAITSHPPAVMVPSAVR